MQRGIFDISLPFPIQPNDGQVPIMGCGSLPGIVKFLSRSPAADSMHAQEIFMHSSPFRQSYERACCDTTHMGRSSVDEAASGRAGFDRRRSRPCKRLR